MSASTRRLTRQQARQIAVRAALLDARGAHDLPGMVRDLASLRVELTTTVAPAAEHVAWTRLGDSLGADAVAASLTDGTLFERGWLLHPMSDLPLYLSGMRNWAERAGVTGWLDDNAGFADSILDRIADQGPLTSREVPDDSNVPWPSTGWTNNRNVTQMLECLHMTGKLAVVGREGKLRVWDLASTVFPDVDEVGPTDARRIRSEQLLHACGIMRDSIAVAPTELHNNLRVGELAEVEGVPGKWRVDPAQLGRDFEGRTAILSPFDRLLTDKQRHTRIFDFDYWLEMYKPVEQRIWGQFALPILHGDELIGKIDARSDRDTARFVVHRVHQDTKFDRATRVAVDDEIDRLASWMGLRTEREERKEGSERNR